MIVVERQYEHIEGRTGRTGGAETEAEEIAARTVNKERARSGGGSVPSGYPLKTCPQVAAVVSDPIVGQAA
jgi:hypothetical protein